jgi:hypothetical protein
VLLVPDAALAARPVKDVALFRVDASLAPTSYLQRISTEDSDEASNFAFTLGPRLGLNLGWGPSRLIRLGIGGAAAFAMSVADDDGFVSAEVDGWARWTVGPSVGFRFGPKVPIELDIAVNFANFQALGEQTTAVGGSDSFDALAKQYGMTSTALLLFRPGGSDSPFALHAGLEGTWGMATATTENDGASSASGFMQSLLLGVSIGL